MEVWKVVLKSSAMSVIMSDMRAKPAAKKPAKRRAPPLRDTFTVRELNREPQSVLTAARKLGRVTIRSRDGGNFVLTPEKAAANERVLQAQAFKARQEAFRKQMRDSGFVPPTEKESDRISRMIAGDES